MRPPLLLLLVAVAACRRGPTISPVAVVESVYSVQLTTPVVGLPTEAQADHFAPYLGDSLNRLLAQARAIRDSAARAHPDEKPPWADGDIFSSLFEGPTSFYALNPIPGEVVKVPIRFERNDHGTPIIWVDTALVARHRGRWVIEDVIYGGTWSFAPRGTLRTQLQR